MIQTRQLVNWLDSYMEYVKETESAAIFKTWVGISTISTALRRKIRFKLGRLRIYPNLYIVLVGPPGARKTQAIKFGYELIESIDDIKLCADSPTREALIQDIQSAQSNFFLSDNEEEQLHASITAIIPELETFLGSKRDNSKMLTFLTDLWDCPDHWRYRTKGAGSNHLENVFLGLMGATTPESLSNCMPASASGTGFTSRIIFCYADKKDNKVPIPEDNEEINVLKDKLLGDLGIIATMSGEYAFSPEGKKFWIAWYTEYEDADPDRICKDPMFNGWYERKPTFVIKIGIIVAASKSSVLMLTPEDMLKALKIIEEAEGTMENAFKVVGRSEISVECDLIFDLIKRHGEITDQKLRELTWRDIDSKKFENVIDTVAKSGRVTYKFRFNSTLYKWIEK